MSEAKQWSEVVEGEVAQLVEARLAADRRLFELAKHRPPITLDEVCADGCNITDRTVRDNIGRFMDTYDRIDVSALDTKDIDKWQLVHGSERFVAREYTDDEGETWWGVFDTSSPFDDERVEEEILSEREAEAEAERRNYDATMEGLVGFPFAWNYGFEIEEREAQDWSDAGFVVWRYDDDKLIAGIDGGGYSFEGAHYAPLYFAKMKGGTIETNNGYREVG